MATLGFTQDGSKVSSDKGKTLLDATGYRQLGSGLRHPIMSGKNPNRSRTIIDLEGATSNDAIRVDYPSRDRNLFTRIASGISV